MDMMKAGMTVARLNFSHGSHEEHGNRIQTIRKAIQTYGGNLGQAYPLALALDTKGPEIRTGMLKEVVQFYTVKKEIIFLISHLGRKIKDRNKNRRVN